MGDRTGIEWTEATWNPTTGCTKVSRGCDHCYAERMSLRLKRAGVSKYSNGFDLTVHEEALSIPFHWRRPRKVFVNSMSDLFHKEIPDDFRERVFRVMLEADWHVYQVLTKRSSLMRGYINRRWPSTAVPPHIWLGVSVENASAKSRIEHLKGTNAQVRFLSLEPLLGPVGELDLTGINWVIVGCESGPGARHMNWEWLREIRDLCLASGVKFFLKQAMVEGKLVGLPELDGRRWAEYPNYTLPVRITLFTESERQSRRREPGPCMDR